MGILERVAIEIIAKLGVKGIEKLSRKCSSLNDTIKLTVSILVIFLVCIIAACLAVHFFETQIVYAVVFGVIALALLILIICIISVIVRAFYMILDTIKDMNDCLVDQFPSKSDPEPFNDR